MSVMGRRSEYYGSGHMRMFAEYDKYWHGIEEALGFLDEHDRKAGSMLKKDGRPPDATSLVNSLIKRYGFGDIPHVDSVLPGIPIGTRVRITMEGYCSGLEGEIIQRLPHRRYRIELDKLGHIDLPASKFEVVQEAAKIKIS